MIPRHRPPFGLLTAILAAGRRSASVAEVERLYADVAEVPHAVLLPSGRAGIYWALRTAVPGTSVVVPAYTCDTVHEAVFRTGAPLRFIDTAADGFLMDPGAADEALSRPHCLVLCELYGLAYDLKRFGANPATTRLRVIDSAPSVVFNKLFQRIEAHDFAIVSFGTGKSMYAGWGAVGLTRNRPLADAVRASRDSGLRGGGRRLVLHRTLAILARTAAYTRPFYAPLRRLREGEPAENPPAYGRRQGPADWTGDRSQSPEWYLPSTRIDRSLAVSNADRREWFWGHRLDLARRYHQRLTGLPGVINPPESGFPFSHYSVRVPPEIRPELRRTLWRQGIDASSLFAFPWYLSRAEFPRAYARSREVINLPLSSDLDSEDVDFVCDRFADFMSEEGARFGSPPLTHAE